jgi:hypothetical protein
MSVTSAMRGHVAGRTHDHFGFSGYRAAIACLYARPEGASQDEVNEAAAELGSTQKGYFNMLSKAREWRHGVLTWDHPTRGRIYKLVYEPSHEAPRAKFPPSNWAQMNQTPYGVTPTSYRPRSAKQRAVARGRRYK